MSREDYKGNVRGMSRQSLYALVLDATNEALETPSKEIESMLLIEKICDTFKSDFSQALVDLKTETPGHFYSFSLNNTAEFVELVELATNKLQTALLSILPASVTSSSVPPAS